MVTNMIDNEQDETAAEENSEVAQEAAPAKTLEDLKKQVARGKSAMKSIHEESEEDENFYGGKQLKAGDKEGYVFNVLPAFVHAVTNVARQSPPGIKIDAISDATSEMARQRQGLVRAIEYECNAQQAYLYALEGAAKGGIGWVRVAVVEDASGEKRIMIKSIIDPRSVVTEPRQRPDLTDTPWIAYELEMTGSEYKAEFPCGTATNDDYARVVVTEMWEMRGGKMYQCIFDEKEILTEETEYPGLILPLVPVTGEFRLIDKEWHYAGIVRDVVTTQRKINYLETEALQQMANAPKAGFVGDEDADTGHERAWANANRERRTILRKKKGSEIVPVPPAPAPSGHMALAEQSYGMISQITGIKPSFGAQLDMVSGKSVRYQQGQASISNYHLLDSLANMVRRVGEIVNDLIPHYYNDDRIRMILGEDQSVTPVSFGPNEIPNATNHDLSKGRYAVRISAGPAYGSQKDAIMDQLAEFARMDPEVMRVFAPFFMRAINLAGADDLANQLKMLLPPPVQQMLASQGDPAMLAQQMQGQLQQAGQQFQQMQGYIQQLEAKLKEATDRNATTVQVEQMREASAERLAQLEANVKILLEHIGNDAALDQIHAKATANVHEDVARAVMHQPDPYRTHLF